jgi:pSer/pThr/pTyr-binding forkhead associated (FHA) protein
VSRLHAQIRLVGAEFWLEDVLSRNGTRLNGDAVGVQHRLASGDVIEVGEATITVYCEDGTPNPFDYSA